MHSCSLENPIFTAATEFEFEENEKGFFVHAFLISNRVNANNWMVTSEANRLDGEDFVGKPDIVFVNDKGIRDHTTGKTLEESRRIQEPFRKGTIQTVKGTDKGNRLTTTSKIIDADTIAKIKSGEIKFVSPAIFPKTLEDVEIVRTGANSHIHIVHRYNALHRAFVDEPAYGVDAAIGPTCEGKTEDCLVRLQQIHAGIGDDEVDPLRTIPLVKIKTSKCSETGNLVLEMPAGELNDMVSKCLSEKGGEPTDQDIAICFEESRKKLNKSKAKESKSATTKSNKDGKSSTGIKMPTDEEKDKIITALKSKAQEIEEELKQSRKANEELTEEKKKEEAKRAQEDEDKKQEDARKAKARAKKGQDDMTEEEKKEAQEEEEKKEAQEDEKKEKDIVAKVASEFAIKYPLVEKYVSAKVAQKNLDEKATTELRKTMLTASVEEIKSKLDDIGQYAAMKNTKSDSEIGYGGNEALTASKFDNITDSELEEKALGVVQ